MRRNQPGRILSALLAALVLDAGVGLAQDLRARIQGIVSDASQAVVVGAKVRLRNVNTGVEALRETNHAGQYVFDSVIEIGRASCRERV